MQLVGNGLALVVDLVTADCTTAASGAPQLVEVLTRLLRGHSYAKRTATIEALAQRALGELIADLLFCSEMSDPNGPNGQRRSNARFVNSGGSFRSLRTTVQRCTTESSFWKLARSQQLVAVHAL